MARKPRVEYEGAIYHVIQRGNNREFIFEHDNEKQYLLKQLARQKEALGFNLFGYAVMGNHYHFIVQTTGGPLHKVMHYVNNSYRMYYNNTRERTGHVFGGRYKSIPVENEKYIYALLRYVHQNPVRAGICKHVREYPWSSDRDYRENRNGFVDIDLIFDMVSPDRDEAIAKYKEFVEEIETEDYSSVNKIGSEDFDPVADSEPKEYFKELDLILQNTVTSDEYVRLIKEGCRKRCLMPYKKAYVQQAQKQGYTQRQIALHLGISEYAIYKLLK